MHGVLALLGAMAAPLLPLFRSTPLGAALSGANHELRAVAADFPAGPATPMARETKRDVLTRAAWALHLVVVLDGEVDMTWHIRIGCLNH